MLTTAYNFFCYNISSHCVNYIHQGIEKPTYSDKLQAGFLKLTKLGTDRYRQYLLSFYCSEFVISFQEKVHKGYSLIFT